MEDLPEDFESIEEQIEPGEAPPEPFPGFPWGGLVGGVGVVLVVVFSVQNTDTVPIRFLWVSGEFTLSLVILVTALTSSLITALGGALYRRRRIRRRAERDELRRHRERP